MLALARSAAQHSSWMQSTPLAGDEVTSLLQIARAGRIVVLSIHQPSPQMFSTLDLCYLMCRGQIAFTGRPADAEGFLLSAGLPCPRGTPAAEHLLTVASEPSLRDRLLQFAQQAAQVRQPCQPTLPVLSCSSADTSAIS